MIVRRCASRRALFHDRSILRDYEIAKSAPVVISAIPIPSFQVSGSEHEYDRCDAAANPEITAPRQRGICSEPRQRECENGGRQVRNTELPNRWL